jgi:hypothetical protein
VAGRAVNPERELERRIADYFYDPLGFVYFAFDWDSPPLSETGGPDEWQIDVLNLIGQQLKHEDANDQMPVKISVSSGHGIGKSAEMCWIILWWMSTRPKSPIVVTANTGDQLEQKTWRELAVWHERAINAHWFEHTATAFYAKEDKKRWRANATVWNEDRPAAFAGTHDRSGAGVLYLFDEASEIPPSIFETSEGAMTDPGALWVIFGNPTSPTGPFVDTFKKDSPWLSRKIDSRTCRLPNKKLLEQWEKLHGEDSDFFRVRVRGEFPRQSAQNFIGVQMVDDAMARTREECSDEGPAIMGVDIARAGQNMNCAVLRKGRQVKEIRRWSAPDTTQTVEMIARLEAEWRPDAVVVDGAGVGGPVIDRLRHERNFKVIEEQGGRMADDKEKFANRKSELWYRMKEFLVYGMLPPDEGLKRELISVTYDHNAKDQLVIASKKETVKKMRASPDAADALSLTFGPKVRPKSWDSPVLRARLGTIA